MTNFPRSERVSSPLDLSGQSERAQQMRSEPIGQVAQVGGDTERAQVRHFQALVAARIDAAERLEIHCNVERHSMIAARAADAQSDAGELAAVDVDARRIATADRSDVPLCNK